jgi:hypothetical protein
LGYFANLCICLYLPIYSCVILINMRAQSIFPYFLRLALAIYFIWPHLSQILNAAKNLKLNNTIFACASQYLPTMVTFNIYHALFVLLGLTIMFWPYPIVPLCAGLLVLAFNLYINFSTQNYGVESLYLLALILVSLALLVYYKFRGRF